IGTVLSEPLMLMPKSAIRFDASSLVAAVGGAFETIVVSSAASALVGDVVASCAVTGSDCRLQMEKNKTGRICRVIFIIERVDVLRRPAGNRPFPNRETSRIPARRRRG